MATLTLRIVKGSPLTNVEVDNNFVELNNNKVQLGGDIGGTTSSPVVISLRGRSLSSATPTTGQALVWNGSAWIPQTVSTGNSNVSSTVTSTVTNTIANTVSSTVTTVPAFAVYLDAAQTSQTILGNGTQQKVIWNAEEFDTNNNFTNSRFTPTVAGYYQLNATVRIDGGTLGTGENMIVIWKNGAEYHRGWNNTGMLLGNTWASMNVSALAYANGTTDYFEVYVQHGSTSNLVLTRGSNISWFNGIKVPTNAITAVTSNAQVTSTVITNTFAGGGGGVKIIDDIYNQFNNRKQIFTLEVNGIAITEGIDYGDNKDFTVSIGGRMYNAAVTKNNQLGPWISDYVAERTYSFKVSGSKLIFYRPIRNRQTAEIRINNVSASRQTRSRYPISANSIVLGD